MTSKEIAVAWLLAYGGALAGYAARVGHMLFGVGEMPPTEPAAYQLWRRKRRWLLISEFCALPLFASAAVASALMWQLPIVMVVIGSMIAGALGFAFLLHALQTIVSKRLGLGAAQ